MSGGSSLHVNERCGRKEERSKQGDTNNKAKQHNTPEAVTFPKKNEQPRVGLQTHDTLHSRQSALPLFMIALGAYL